MSRAVEAVYAEEWGRIVAALIRLTGDWDLAEECAQDAFAQAVAVWRRDGVPSRPGAWLTTTARNRAMDRLRRRATESVKLREVARMEQLAPPPDPDDDGTAIPDERLELVFTCCHPALSTEAQVALTLRTLAGLSTAEIARAFLVSEHTMGQRLFRAKNKIRNAGIPFRVPPDHLLPERTAAVLAVLYLLFNEGYSASSGAELVRGQLTGEAIRLARTLVALMPDEPEALGLLALMLLHDARSASRLDANGDFVPLEEQDRSVWNGAEIADGLAVLDRALLLSADLAPLRQAPRRRRPGAYQIQAAIAACHATAASPAETDWAQIALLYGQLAARSGNPVVELNRAVAVAMADGPAAGLSIVDELAASGRLAGYHLLPATRADLLRRLGRSDEAAGQYRAALDLATTDAERRYLRRRLAELGTRP